MDFADDLLDDVFHRHQSGRPAVLVDDDRQGTLPRPQFAQQQIQPGMFAHEQRLAGHLLGGALGRQPAQDIPGVGHPDNVVFRVPEDRQTAEARFHNRGGHLGQRRLGRDSDHVDPRHHDLRHGLIRELQNIGDPAALRRAERRGVDQFADRFGRILFLLFPLLHRARRFLGPGRPGDAAQQAVDQRRPPDLPQRHRLGPDRSPQARHQLSAQAQSRHDRPAHDHRLHTGRFEQPRQPPNRPPPRPPRTG